MTEESNKLIQWNTSKSDHVISKRRKHTTVS